MKRWDPKTEDFMPEDQMDLDEVRRYQLGTSEIIYYFLLFFSCHFVILGVTNFDFDRELGVYPADAYPAWQGLSNFISEKVSSFFFRMCEYDAIESTSAYFRSNEQVLDKLEPVGKHIASEDRNSMAAEAASIGEKQKNNYDEKITSAHIDLSKNRTVVTHASFFTHVPTRITARTYASGSVLSAAEVTRSNFDKSAILEQLLAAEYKNGKTKCLSFDIC